MRDRDEDIGDPLADRHLLGSSRDEHAGLSPGALEDLDISPRDPTAPTAPDRLQDRLLRRPEAREILDRMLARLTITDFAIGVDPSKEELAVVLDHLADPWAFDD